MQRNVLPQHKIACFFVSMPNGSTTIQLYAKLSVHINQASVSYRASVGFLGGNASSCSVLNKLTLQKSKIKMKYSKKQYNYYSDDERMSYIREYLSSPESKSEFCKRHGFCAKLLTYWLNKYQIEDKDMGRSSKPVNSDAIDSSISELQKELSLLRAENRKLHRALADESLRHEACEELINLAESTYHIKVRKNSDAK